MNHWSRYFDAICRTQQDLWIHIDASELVRAYVHHSRAELIQLLKNEWTKVAYYALCKVILEDFRNRNRDPFISEIINEAKTWICTASSIFSSLRSYFRPKPADAKLARLTHTLEEKMRVACCFVETAYDHLIRAVHETMDMLHVYDQLILDENKPHSYRNAVNMPLVQLATMHEAGRTITGIITKKPPNIAVNQRIKTYLEAWQTPYNLPKRPDAFQLLGKALIFSPELAREIKENEEIVDISPAHEVLVSSPLILAHYRHPHTQRRISILADLIAAISTAYTHSMTYHHTKNPQHLY